MDWGDRLVRANQRGVLSLIVLLCICILIQMLGLPVTFLSLLASDDLLKSQLVSEDFSTPSQVQYSEGLVQGTGSVYSSSMLKLLILQESFFHPPAA